MGRGLGIAAEGAGVGREGDSSGGAARGGQAQNLDGEYLGEGRFDHLSSSV
jgi:hypothetical protein